MSDLIERKKAIEALNRCTDVYHTNLPPLVDKEEVRRALASLPSAQPEMNLDEWCTDCKEYDHKRHCCPKWNRVIRQTLKDAQPEPQWIPVSERLPEYGVAVLTYDGHCFCVEKRIPTIRDDECEPITGDWWVSDDYDEYDSDYYPNLRDGACIAWMPLPEPYRAERRTDD